MLGLRVGVEVGVRVVGTRLVGLQVGRLDVGGAVGQRLGRYVKVGEDEGLVELGDGVGTGDTEGPREGKVVGRGVFLIRAYAGVAISGSREGILVGRTVGIREGRGVSRMDGALVRKADG